MQKDSTIINVVLAGEAATYCQNLENKITLSKQLSQQFFRASTDAQRNEIKVLKSQCNKNCPPEAIKLAEILTTVASNFLSTDELKDCISKAGKGVDFSDAYRDKNAPNFATLWALK